MNLILFEERSDEEFLPSPDPRVRHLRKVLRMDVGDRFDVGVVNGPRGKASIQSDDPDKGMHLRFNWETDMPQNLPIELLVGLPRPQAARRILRECTSLGVSRFSFFQADKGEPSYGQSSLWSTGEWRRLLIQGAEQAFHTRLPVVTHHNTLYSRIAQLDATSDKFALDLYEATVQLSAARFQFDESVVAIGPERGWSAAERDALRQSEFTLARIGDRVLRTETAATVAVSLVDSMMRLL